MGGIETYFRELIRWLPTCAGSEHEVVFILDRDLRKTYPDIPALVFEAGAVKTAFFRLLESFTSFRCSALTGLIEKHGFDAFFCPHQAMFPVECPVTSVITVHDVQHLYFPKYFSLIDHAFRATIWVKSLSECDRIIAISRATSDALVERCGVDPEKISVVHHGFPDIDPDSVSTSQLVQGQYYYYPAASYPHKGHVRLINAFALLKRCGAVSTDTRLVFSGMKTGYWKKVHAVIAANGWERDVIHLGHIPYEEVLSLYKGACAVFFPSEHEGFGIPLLEAARFGKKIICSQLPVFEEIGVPSEDMVDFEDIKSVATALERSGRTVLKYAPSSWAQSIRNTFETIVRLVES